MELEPTSMAIVAGKLRDNPMEAVKVEALPAHCLHVTHFFFSTPKHNQIFEFFFFQVHFRAP